ncbi:MAG: ABC transporter permease subunit [Haloarculaceae archaeon]
MNGLTVAKKDVRDTLRSQALWALTMLFVTALAGLTIGFVLSKRRASFPGLLAFVNALVIWLVPITALVLSYKAIVGEHETGTMAVLLSLPLSRADVVGGKAVGRAITVTGSILVGFLVMGVISAVLYAGFMPGLFLVFVGLSLLLGLVFTSVAIAVSAMTHSTVRAASGAIGSFVAFLFLWDLVPAAIYYLLHGTLPGSRYLPTWYFLLERLNPKNAFTAIVTELHPTMLSPLPSPAPFYLSTWFFLLVLVLWIVAPLVIGYGRFRTMELR